MFEDDVKEVVLPGTSQISVCSSCNGTGSNLCFHCRGSGSVRCTACNGTGMRSGIPHPAITAHPLVAALPHGNVSRGYPSSSVATAKSRNRSSFGVGTPAHLRSVTGIPPPGISIVDLCAICAGTGLCQ
ncbi:unnamed protein product [Soboliphyme baturini]|uniref:DnaJ/Hsp40 cysteine-rich domain superfamily protein n=1 Tax=Soboliphyme baturini TaxID=241478 RepID=A0A183J1M9_9BILA|nr:unnamed protein product [Soboliphyme baturini]